MNSNVDGEDGRKPLEYARGSTEPLWRWFMRRAIIFVAVLAGIAALLTAIARIGDHYGWFDFMAQK